MSSIFYTPESLHRYYPTRKKLRKFKKRYRARHGRKFMFFIAEYKHVPGPNPLPFGIPPDGTYELLFFKRQPDH